MADDGILVLKQKYDAAVIDAAENGSPPPPPFHEWVKLQTPPTLADVLAKK